MATLDLCVLIWTKSTLDFCVLIRTKNRKTSIENDIGLCTILEPPISKMKKNLVKPLQYWWSVD